MPTELWNINETFEPGKKVQLTPEFEKYTIAQWLDKKSTQNVKTQIENYWNNYINTGGKAEFAKKSIGSAIDRQILRAKDDLQRQSPAMAGVTLDTNTIAPNTPSGTLWIKNNHLASIPRTINAIKTRNELLASL